MYGIAFEWDRRKDSANQRKHGVGFAEATTVFDDPLSVTIPDPDDTTGEERFVIPRDVQQAKPADCGSYY
jgi:uncharacterized DUF497 family protein